ncbi:MAG TPA: 16S rRNA (guanine(966)-N(2))-methyltransferase RsmD [Bryobacteraceae bacterium]|nr:16S rRNA (guanine(966)-N(2))-methyltransferase RsmD [Bryobacteraceae bacterium]
MRVIAGEFRSRVLKPVPGYDVRPTPDRLRETLFNILQTRIEGLTFLDAYAGTGAVGIEAVSRGAAKAILIEKSKPAIEVIQENVRGLGIQARVEVLRGSVQLLLPRHPADLVFLDPPYPLTAEYETALRILGAAPPSLVVVQHASKHQLEERYGRLNRIRVVKQGDNSLSFYEPEQA